MQTEDKILVLRRVRVSYQLRIPLEHRETAERVHAFHAQYCPVARSLAGAVECTTELQVESNPPE